jgi:hypothetical protein
MVAPNERNRPRNLKLLHSRPGARMIKLNPNPMTSRVCLCYPPGEVGLAVLRRDKPLGR